MVPCRKMTPFTVTFDRNLMQDWSGALAPFFLDSPVGKGKKSLKIHSYVHIKYKEDDIMQASPTHTSTFSHFRFSKKTYDMKILRTIRIDPDLLPGVNSAKLEDVRGLYMFMDHESIDWIEDVLEDGKAVSS
ncbi:hypothetical protein PR048_018501 [Dryococelus australis]|uniref:Uncharacterized protein n=1 Tax=Dryococelus australis TaxID=614101 RepID=A0ABQ9HCH3_9NEOP|nr:hypothetical protein PR048_018501 [Dryococelus australis]